MAPVICPRCGGALAAAAAHCSGCDRPITLDLTARVPKEGGPKIAFSRSLIRDGVLLFGGVAGMVAASLSDDWKLASGLLLSTSLVALALHFTKKV